MSLPIKGPNMVLRGRIVLLSAATGVIALLVACSKSPTDIVEGVLMRSENNSWDR